MRERNGEKRRRCTSNRTEGAKRGETKRGGHRKTDRRPTKTAAREGVRERTERHGRVRSAGRKDEKGGDWGWI